MSSPAAPLRVLAASLLVSVLSSALPVAILAVEPVISMFSTLLAMVKSTEVLIRSVPSELFSVTTSEVLSTV